MVEMVEDVADRKTPTKSWVKDIRSKGISIYGEKQWMDWETFLVEVAEYTTWAHPSWVAQHENSWQIKGECYDMKEINWSLLGLLMKHRRYMPKSDRLTKFTVLYV